MRIRTSTVIWAAILLVLAAVAFSVAVFDLREYQAAVAAWIVVGLGGVFVVSALIALIVRAVSKASVVEAPAAPAERVAPVERVERVEPVETPVATPVKKPRVKKDQPID